ncbi:ABC transporter ATP-binding protein [Paenibacillus sp. YN15]|uniref:ABC transporter ATP-binding protein n=1 Tax=Paenibacillus sp. YN15 TaxID=1742774 RepID=UPI000DCDB944|nr:ABC transporter ATP-binding protein [Paenibacillus sp. YN15]RAU95520.1 ABC transporter ATP-binding protein [Paenibacillus sp. YN15]
MKPGETVLSVKNLKKKIRSKWIIKGVSFDVGAGEVFGFLGPNGAGKTTTIRMLVNLIRPTEGSIEICGIPLQDRPFEALRQIGCIVENPELYPYLTGWENLEHFARMIPGVTEARIREVVVIVGMEQRIRDKVKTYSLGMRQRLGIAQALLGSPKLLILDEPTNGLDPQGIKEMREFIRKLAEEGLSVFVSSHLLSEIQLMCDRVAIISHGEVIAVGEVKDLIEKNISTVMWHTAPRETALKVIGAFPGVQLAEERETVQAEELKGTEAEQGIRTEMGTGDIPALSRALQDHQVSLYEVSIKHPTLEELFLRLTEGERIE